MKCSLLLLPLALLAAAKPMTTKSTGGKSSPLHPLASPIRQPLRLVASTDLKGANEDYATLAPKQTAEFAKLTGPFTLVRLWFTGAPIERMSVSMVVDGKTTALRKQGKFAGWPKDPAFGGAPDKSYWSYLPVPVSKSFKLVATNHGAEPAKFFYQVGYRERMTSDANWVKSTTGWLSKTSTSGEPKLFGGTMGRGKGGLIPTQDCIVDWIQVQMSTTNPVALSSLFLQIDYPN